MWIIVKFYPDENSFQYFGTFDTKQAAQDYGERIWRQGSCRTWGTIKLVTPAIG